MSNDAGRIVNSRNQAAFAEALEDVLAGGDRVAVRRYAENYSWDETSNALSALYNRIINEINTPIRTAPAINRKFEKQRLLFTIDTEETFDWTEFSPAGFRVERPAGLERLQALLDAYAVRPIYFLTYPVMTDAENAGFFRRLAEEKRADLGLHLHQWTTPPIDGFEGEYYSWQCNLPLAAQIEKLKAFTATFEQSFGFKPIAHRAGRYGIDARACRALAASGVRYDFSPSVAFDYSKRGGPDFSSMCNTPFGIETPEGRLFVTPVSGARAIRGGNRFLNQETSPAGFPAPVRANRFPPTAPLRLSCENARFEELVALTRHLADAGVPVLTFSLHSTTLTPGSNEYAPDAASVDAAMALTERYLEFFMKDYRGEPISLTKLAELYGPAG